MGEVGFLYKSSVALGCLILMLASIACTGWFFYSWLGGIPGIVGACVGCAVQLMAYGFSGVIVHQRNGLPRVVLFCLIASALALSVLSSYATLNGYFTALQQQRDAKAAITAQKEQAVKAALSNRMALMNSMSRDVEIGSEAAGQGLADKYRTQANQFLKNNAATRDEMVAQIEQVEALASSGLLSLPQEEETSPIDGLSGLLGGQGTAIMILCIWLALMFDALPIVGIALFEARTKKSRSEKEQVLSEIEPLTLVGTQQIPMPISQEPPTEQPLKQHTIETSPKEAPEETSFRLLTNLCSMDVQTSKAFYTQLLDFETRYDSDWYVQLCSPHDDGIEFGVIRYDHELVPNEYRRLPSGMYLTFMVPDVNASYARALEMNLDIIQEPRNEFYGQRRFLVKDPSGCLIDICSPWNDDNTDENTASRDEHALSTTQDSESVYEHQNHETIVTNSTPKAVTPTVNETQDIKKKVAHA